jgi:hypothetical protein
MVGGWRQPYSRVPRVSDRERDMCPPIGPE